MSLGADVPVPVLMCAHSGIQVRNKVPLSYVTSPPVSQNLAPLPVAIDRVAHTPEMEHATPGPVIGDYMAPTPTLHIAATIRQRLSMLWRRNL